MNRIQSSSPAPITNVATSRITRLRFRPKNSVKRRRKERRAAWPAGIGSHDRVLSRVWQRCSAAASPMELFAADKNRAYTPPVRAAWKKFRYRLEWIALKAVAQTIPLLSRNACYRLGQAIGALAARFDRRNHRVAMSNLRAAFGDALSPAQRKDLVRESYQQFA